MVKELYRDTEKKMEKSLESLGRDLASIRTGRASLSILEGITVEYYDTPTPLNQVATLSVPESRLIVIQPWDTTVIKDIEKVIMRSDLGLTPSNDGKVVRIPIPPLTEERRVQLVKVVKRHGEDCKVAVRNIRRDAISEAKEFEKEKIVSEDDLHRAQDEIQKITDRFIDRVDEVVQKKENEILEV
jgi:ribosome recycling factor